MKKYKEYMNRVSLREEAHEKILNSIKETEMSSEASEGKSVRSPQKRRNYFGFRWMGAAAAAFVGLIILGAVLVFPPVSESGRGVTSAHSDAATGAYPVTLVPEATAASGVPGPAAIPTPGSQETVVTGGTQTAIPGASEAYYPTDGFPAPEQETGAFPGQEREGTPANTVYYGTINDLDVFLLQRSPGTEQKIYMLSDAQAQMAAGWLLDTENGAWLLVDRDPDYSLSESFKEGLWLFWQGGFYRFQKETANEELRLQYSELLKQLGIEEGP